MSFIYPSSRFAGLALSINSILPDSGASGYKDVWRNIISHYPTALDRNFKHLMSRTLTYVKHITSSQYYVNITKTHVTCSSNGLQKIRSIPYETGAYLVH